MLPQQIFHQILNDAMTENSQVSVLEEGTYTRKSTIDCIAKETDG